jgi:hypothetical protein
LQEARLKYITGAACLQYDVLAFDRQQDVKRMGRERALFHFAKSKKQLLQESSSEHSQHQHHPYDILTQSAAVLHPPMEFPKHFCVKKRKQRCSNSNCSSSRSNVLPAAPAPMPATTSQQQQAVHKKARHTAATTSTATAIHEQQQHQNKPERLCDDDVECYDDSPLATTACDGNAAPILPQIDSGGIDTPSITSSSIFPTQYHRVQSNDNESNEETNKPVGDVMNNEDNDDVESLLSRHYHPPQQQDQRPTDYCACRDSDSDRGKLSSLVNY